MLETYQLFKIFISSPGDVPNERQLAEQVINDVDNSCRDTLGVQVDAHSWKRLPPLTPKMSERTIQDIINEEVRECNVFVLILNKRYGSVEQGQTKSNTEREINVALKMLSEGSNIMFLSYFRDLHANDDPGQQEEKVIQLRNRLEKRGVFYRTYSSPDNFKTLFTHDLYHTILKYQVSTTKRKMLSQFWQFGIPEGATHPRLAIIYPPVDRYFMRQDNPDRFWLNRLVPHIVFEDFKALQKIEKTLRLIGFRDFEFFSVAGKPPDVEDRNRFWICLPRNEPARHQLSLYENKVLFSFKKRQLGAETRLSWESPSQKKNITICSPLGKYLTAQREVISGGEWTLGHGRIVAKDYAILARFSDKRKRRPMSHGSLKDYFIAGIRGLGTWGAAWFIDRRYPDFKDHFKRYDCDIQMLLEVVYRNEQIHDVRDVSKEPQSYFNQENDIRVIRARIKEHY